VKVPPRSIQNSQAIATTPFVGAISAEGGRGVKPGGWRVRAAEARPSRSVKPLRTLG
jgi:hypothetical protein